MKVAAILIFVNRPDRRFATVTVVTGEGISCLEDGMLMEKEAFSML